MRLLACGSVNRAERPSLLERVTLVVVQRISQAVEDKLDQSDKEQRAFYMKVYGRKDASPYEFDLVINCDYITQPAWAADIVEKAFQRKFKI